MKLRCPECAVIIRLRKKPGARPGTKVRLACPKCAKRIQAVLPRESIQEQAKDLDDVMDRVFGAAAGLGLADALRNGGGRR